MSRAFRPDALQEAVEAGDVALAVGEHDRLGDVLLRDQPHQRPALELAARHRDQRPRRPRRPWWPGARPRSAPGRCRKRSMIRRTPGGMVAENSSVWRAAGEQAQDPLDVGHEAHVEHPVGLVEHDDVDAAQQHLAAVEPVEQAAGRGDQDVDALLQRLLLVAHADAADQQRHGQVEILAVDLEVLRPSGSRARASARGSASAASAPGPGRWPGCAASAGRTRPSCRCRSGRCRSRRGRPAPAGWRRPGSAWACCSRRRRWPSGSARRDRGPRSRAESSSVGIKEKAYR